MRILYDGQIYRLQPTAGGINRYFANLISRLPKNFTPFLTTYQSRKINYPAHPNLKKILYPGSELRPRRFSFWLEKYYFRAVTAFNHFDVIHPTYYWLLTRQHIDSYRRPLVLTVHDMIHEIFDERMDLNDRLAKVKRTAVLAAQAIICVSENTKKDLLELYSLPENKIRVIYSASEIDESLSHGDEPIPSRPYYLYVGSRNPNYKNFDTLLAAFAKVIYVYPDIMLCVVGEPFKETEKKLIAELKLTEHIELYTNISDRHLAKLYRCSLGFVYPSLYEGFGIPPLEAMSCGTSVIASNCSSIPEVVGDAGILFNPRATSDLADILISLVDSPAERERLIAKGYERSKLFSWDKTADETLKVYHSVV